METREDANQVIERGLYVDGKKVWGRKQVQELRRCLKCQCFGEHKATECQSIHEVCSRCSKHHRTSLCRENNKESLVCSNCKAANNVKHMGHGTADRRCPIFLEQIQRMNKAKNNNQYKFYCTSDLATWEFNEPDTQEGYGTDASREVGGNMQREERVRGRLGGGGRGEGGGTQRVLDKGWEGMRGDMRKGGYKDKDNSSIQTKSTKQGNVNSIRSNSRDKDSGKSQQTSGRSYKQGIHKDLGPSQTTLNECWKDKEKEL